MMAKKSRKKQTSEKVRQKRGGRKFRSDASGYDKLKANPFELKYNRQKHSVIGKTADKSAAGIPGLSRKRALEQRERTLLSEYQRFGSKSRLSDRRLGERNPSLTHDQRVANRFALERQKRFGGRSNVALVDQPSLDLTHGGQSLAEIEQHERPRHSEDDRFFGNMDSEFVERLHFGGGDLENGEKPRSRKDAIGDMIARSKLMRCEKIQQNEERLNKTDELDMQWKEIVNTDLFSKLLASANRLTSESAGKLESADKSYDRYVHELQFDNKLGAATDKLKKPEEVAKEEQERLESSEKERLERMKSKIDVNTEQNGNLDSRNKSSFVVAYSADGKLINEHELGTAVASDTKVRFSDEIQEQDWLNSEEIDYSTNPAVSVVINETDKIPYLIEMPASFDAFQSLLNNYATKFHGVVLERLIKCHHPSLKEGNKTRLQKLFVMVLRHFDFVSRSAKSEFQYLDMLSKFLYDLLKTAPDFAGKAVKNLIDRHRKVFRKNGRNFPPKNCFLLLKLLPGLFPASDFWHPVMTPAKMLAAEILTKVHNRSMKDIAKGLILCSILADYFMESKRYCPELVAYLLGVLHVAVDHADHERSLTRTFPVSDPHRKMLLIREKIESEVTVGLSMSDVFASEDSGNLDSLKLACVNTCLHIVEKLCTLCADLPSCSEILRPFLRQINRLPKAVYTEVLSAKVQTVTKTLEDSLAGHQKSALKVEKQRVEPEFQFLEPRIEPDFNPDRAKKHGGAQKGPKAERQRLVHKYKKELRGAVRELRKDSQFLARQKLGEEAIRDRERREKTKGIMQSLMGQEAEHKRYKRMKDVVE